MQDQRLSRINGRHTTLFAGRNCDIAASLCNSNPCLHNEACHGKINNYTCDCSNKCAETHCELQVNIRVYNVYIYIWTLYIFYWIKVFLKLPFAISFSVIYIYIYIYHPGNYNCDSSNIIYLLKCNKCNYGNYVGETSTKFRLRMNNHKKAFKTTTKVCR